MLLDYQISTPLMLLALFLPVVAGFILLLTSILGKKIGRRICGVISFVTLVTSTILLLLVSFEVLKRGQPVYEVYHVRVLTLYGDFTLFADWLGLPLAIAIAFLSSLSCLYSISYMDRLEVVHIEPEMAKYSIAYKMALEKPEFVPKRESGVVLSVEAYFANLLMLE